MVTRRAMLGFLGAACVPTPLLARCGPPLLDRAIRRAGGLARLAAVRELCWTGAARVYAGGRTIDIGLSTRVAPFGAARSDSWLASEGPGKPRSLILDADGKGWVERSGKREAMPAAMAAHERAQYAMYGLMLLAPLCAAEVTPIGTVALDVVRPPAPRTQMVFDRDALLIGCENTIGDPEGRVAVLQHFDFADHRRVDGVLWPHRLNIRQNGEPYFDLTLDSFSAD